MFTVCTWCERSGLNIVVQAPPGGLCDMMQQAAQEKQQLREPPSSLDQSEPQHGSVILNKYTSICLWLHNKRPLPLRTEQTRITQVQDSTKHKVHRSSRRQSFHVETRYSTNRNLATRRNQVLWPIITWCYCRPVVTDNFLSEFPSQSHARGALPPLSPSVWPRCLQVAGLWGSVWWFPFIPQVSKSQRYFSITVCLSSRWVDYMFFCVTPSDSKALQVQLAVIPESGLGLSWQGYRGVSFWERHGPLIPVISAVPMVTGAIFPKQTTGGCLSVAAHTLGALHVCPCHWTGELVYMT